MSFVPRYSPYAGERRPYHDYTKQSSTITSTAPSSTSFSPPPSAPSLSLDEQYVLASAYLTSLHRSSQGYDALSQPCSTSPSPSPTSQSSPSSAQLQPLPYSHSDFHHDHHGPAPTSSLSQSAPPDGSHLSEQLAVLLGIPPSSSCPSAVSPLSSSSSSRYDPSAAYPTPYSLSRMQLARDVSSEPPSTVLSPCHCCPPFPSRRPPPPCSSELPPLAVPLDPTVSPPPPPPRVSIAELERCAVRSAQQLRGPTAPASLYQPSARSSSLPQSTLQVSIPTSASPSALSPSAFSPSASSTSSPSASLSCSSPSASQSACKRRSTSDSDRRLKHRLIDANRRRRETKLLERFAWLSGQKDEHVQRDRVTTLEVACDRYEDLVKRVDRMRTRIRVMEAALSDGGQPLCDETSAVQEESRVVQRGLCGLDNLMGSVQYHLGLHRSASLSSSSTLAASTLILCAVSLTTARNLSCNAALFLHSGWQEHEVIGKVSGPVWAILVRHSLSCPPCVQDLSDRPPVKLKNGGVIPMPVSQQRQEVDEGLLRLIRGEADKVEVRWRTGLTDGRCVELLTCAWIVWGNDGGRGDSAVKVEKDGRNLGPRSLGGAELVLAMRSDTLVEIGEVEC